MLRKAFTNPHFFKPLVPYSLSNQPFHLIPTFTQGDTVLPPNKKVQVRCVTLDGGGTTSKFCYEPVVSFIKGFDTKKMKLTSEQARGPMGISKPKHIEELLRTEMLAQWLEHNQSMPDQNTVTEIHNAYLIQQREILKDVIAVPNMAQVITTLRSQGLYIALNTAYSREEAKIFAEALKKQGIEFDFIITSSDVKEGRPHPFMLDGIMQYFGLTHPQELLVVGDTPADMQAAYRRNYPRVGAAGYSSLLNINSNQEGLNMPAAQMLARQETAKTILKVHHANYCMTDSEQLLDIVNDYNQRLLTGNFDPVARIEPPENKFKPR